MKSSPGPTSAWLRLGQLDLLGQGPGGDRQLHVVVAVGDQDDLAQRRELGHEAPDHAAVGQGFQLRHGLIARRIFVYQHRRTFQRPRCAVDSLGPCGIWQCSIPNPAQSRTLSSVSRLTIVG